MLIWADCFDQYGTLAAMLQGAYTYENTYGLSLDTSNPRNGTTALKCANNGFVKRNLGENKKTFGIGAAYYFDAFPSTGDFRIMSGADLDGNLLWSITSTNDGRIKLCRGDTSGTQLAVSDQVLLSKAYQYLEFKVTTGDSDGAFEVRVDGVTVLDISAIDNNNGSSGALPSQVQFGARYNGPVYIDDMICWDTSGDYFNDFPGDHRVRLAALDGDTAQADWTQNTGATGYGALIEIPADGDTTYVEALEPYLASEYDFADTPDDVGQVSGVFLQSMLRKTDTGDCDVQMSLVSGSSEALGTERPMTTLYTYYGDAFVVDPNTGAPFTPADLSAARVKITRTV